MGIHDLIERPARQRKVENVPVSNDSAITEVLAREHDRRVELEGLILAEQHKITDLQESITALKEENSELQIQLRTVGASKNVEVSDVMQKLGRSEEEAQWQKSLLDTEKTTCQTLRDQVASLETELGQSRAAFADETVLAAELMGRLNRPKDTSATKRFARLETMIRKITKTEPRPVVVEETKEIIFDVKTDGAGNIMQVIARKE